MNLVIRFAQTYFVRHTLWYVGGMLALLGTNGLTIYILMLLGQATDALEQGESGVPAILMIGIQVAGMGIVVMVLRTLSRVLYFTPGRRVEAEVKQDLFDRILSQQPKFLSQWPPGDLISRASSDVGSLRLLAGFGLLQATNVLVILVVTASRMYLISPRLTLWLLVPLIVGLGLTQVSIRWLFVLIKKMQEEIARISDHALSTYDGVSAVKAFGAEGYFEGRFDDLSGAYQATTIRRAGLRAVIGPILLVSALFDVFLLLWLGGDMVISGDISLGHFVEFTGLVALLAAPLRGLGFLIAILKQAQASLERLYAVTDPEPDRPDLDIAAAPPPSAPSLEFRGLTFRYDDGESPVLQDVSFTLPSGATLGVFGGTGSGKTTLLRCVARLYNPPSGTIFVDGRDVRELDLANWRRHAVLVPQRPFLFSESMRDNIVIGAEEHERLPEVLNLAALERDIEALPQGLETQVGEAGLMLSGGQRQRTALARGLMRTPSVLLLDDVLSAVDHATEAQLIGALRNTQGEVSPTTVIVSTRVSAIQHAELIIVLEGGRVVDQGTHAELISRAGEYREVWRRQQAVEASDGG